ncbi:MAG: DUF1816 domain-containing protein [Prochloraceae cyanobacterium]|nr:DUF1816 domain-containing protein [Prochloraceae cyanobacterium]
MSYSLNFLEHNQLKQSYQEQLLKAGIDATHAWRAAQNLSHEELKLISNISPQWADIFYQIEREILAIETVISDNLKLERRKLWIEINTTIPQCTYYFGPFDTLEEAAECQNGYIEDLIEEGASGINVNIKKCQPQTLTVEVF